MYYLDSKTCVVFAQVHPCLASITRATKQFRLVQMNIKINKPDQIVPILNSNVLAIVSYAWPKACPQLTLEWHKIVLIF